MGEIGASVEVVFQVLEAGELLAVVECEGLDESVGDALERRFRCPIQARCPLVLDLLADEIAGLTFHKSGHHPLMMAADDRINKRCLSHLTRTAKTA